jgi:hypothetical protein
VGKDKGISEVEQEKHFELNTGRPYEDHRGQNQVRRLRQVYSGYAEEYSNWMPR